MITLDYASKYGEPITVALGFFDCVHRGHRAILSEAIARAKSEGSLPAVFTFRSCKRAGELPAISFEDRLTIFERIGMQAVVFAEFSQAFSSLSPEEFFQFFCDRFNVKGFVCGTDFRFGKNASGDVALLSKLCQQQGITISILPLLFEQPFESKTISSLEQTAFERTSTIPSVHSIEKISSTQIRQLLGQGDFQTLNNLLGSTFFRTGQVVKGFQKGREIGIRTANLAFGEVCPIGDGVFRTHVTIGENTYPAATFIGTSETFDRVKKTIECHVIGFHEEIYGRTIRVFFESKLRDNRKFETTNELVAQILQDIQACADD